GIWIVGVLIDRHLRALTLTSTLLFCAAALALGLAGTSPAIVYIAVGVWGLAFGGSATLFQTALAKSAGDEADVAQSMLVTAWNIAIAGGGLLGGVLLDQLGVGAFPPALLGLLAATLVVTWTAKRDGFAASNDDSDVSRPATVGRQA
ncbi:MFS transporter, partial [Xanthomonas hortorum]